jgi:rod shape-determining protein MreD
MRKENLHIYIRRAIIAVVIIVAAMLQNTANLFPTIFGARAFLLIPVVVCISMFEKDVTAAIFGAFAGMLWDMTSAVNDGFNTIFLMLIGSVCGILVNFIMRNNMVTAMLLSSGALVLYSLSYWLVFIVARGVEGGAMMILNFFLPCSVYTLAFTPLIYLLIRAFMKKLRDSLPIQRRIKKQR